jgi:hypothetical protein
MFWCSLTGKYNESIHLEFEVHVEELISYSRMFSRRSRVHRVWDLGFRVEGTGFRG